MHTRKRPAKKYTSEKGIEISQTRPTPERHPSFILEIFPAPKFCAVKFEIPFPIVPSEVITRLLSFIDAEYPAITAEPKELIIP